MEKEKKPVHKKWWFWVLAVIIIGSWIGNYGDDESNAKEDPKAEEKQDKKEDKPKEEKKASKKEEKKKDDRTIDQKIQEDSKNVDKAALKDGILTLEKEVTSMWDETSILKHDVYDLFEELRKGFKDKSVQSITVVLKTKMVDNKGDEEVESVVEYDYSRESFEELNYDKFLEMSYSQTWRILNESDAYWIHPGIYKNVKGDYKSNLANGMQKQ